MEGGSWRSAGTFSGSRNGEACAVSAVSPVWSRGKADLTGLHWLVR